MAEAAGKDCEKPAFFYAEERQQNLFKCEACGESNDVLGTYAYCSLRGTRNDLQELEKTVQALRDRINASGPYEIYVKEAVAAFDSFAGQYAKQLLARVPLTPTRKARLEKAHFHSLETVSDMFRNILLSCHVPFGQRNAVRGWLQGKVSFCRGSISGGKVRKEKFA
ncbi:MAG: hypothetical protein ACLP9S_05250 [Syntrophales bacterium]